VDLNTNISLFASREQLKYRSRIVIAIALVMLVAPQAAHAASTIQLSLYSTSCNLAPRGGVTSCTFACPTQCSGVTNLADDAAQTCLTWSSDGHLSVSVTSHSGGSPGPLSDSNPICKNLRDWSFDFTVTYISPTCSAGTYTATFTAYKNGGDFSSDSKTFSAYVSCVFSPVP
jgi:hypothetical protein